ILAGDGLCTAAFAALADLGPHAGRALAVLARRAGAAELLAGQARDLALAAGGDTPSLDDLEAIHRGKTGALFAAACELRAIAASADPALGGRLADLGMILGLAFQHADDLDEGGHAALGDEARARWRTLSDEALAGATALGPPGGHLADLARWIGARS